VSLFLKGDYYGLISEPVDVVVFTHSSSNDSSIAQNGRDLFTA